MSEHRSRQLEESRQAFVDADFLRNDPHDDAELWRISLRLAAFSDIDFGEFVQQIKMVLEPMLSAYEYREPILRHLVANQPEDKVKSVYLVGFSSGPREDSPSSVDEDAPEIDQTRIFSHTLVRLLQRARVRVLRLTAANVGKLQTHDCIVILQDDPQFAEDQLAGTGATQFNVRDHRFDPAMNLTAQERGQPISAVYTGLIPVVYKAQRTLLESLVRSTALAFVMIAGVMVLVLRSPTAGLLSMLPNVFPVVMIFGIMGWANVLVDIGSMMTASVAMGVAVDDTIHFLSWFRRGLDEGFGRKKAILLAYRRVATAMTQTTAIGGLGLSTFAFSTFTPTQRFGTLMLALLAAALVGDLLFLPALLASPLGKVFDKKKPREDRDVVPKPHIDGTAGTVKERKQTQSTLPSHVRQDGSHP